MPSVNQVHFSLDQAVRSPSVHRGDQTVQSVRPSSTNPSQNDISFGSRSDQLPAPSGATDVRRNWLGDVRGRTRQQRLDFDQQMRSATPYYLSGSQLVLRAVSIILASIVFGFLLWLTVLRPTMRAGWSVPLTVWFGVFLVLAILNFILNLFRQRRIRLESVFYLERHQQTIAQAARREVSRQQEQANATRVFDQPWLNRQTKSMTVQDYKHGQAGSRGSSLNLPVDLEAGGDEKVTWEAETPLHTSAHLNMHDVAEMPGQTFLEHEELDACPICFLDFEEDTRLRVFPCGHSTCANCVEDGLVSVWKTSCKPHCPLCRHKLHLPRAPHRGGELDNESNIDEAPAASPEPVPVRTPVAPLPLPPTIETVVAAAETPIRGATPVTRRAAPAVSTPIANIGTPIANIGTPIGNRLLIPSTNMMNSNRMVCTPIGNTPAAGRWNFTPATSLWRRNVTPVAVDEDEKPLFHNDATTRVTQRTQPHPEVFVSQSLISPRAEPETPVTQDAERSMI